MHAVFSLDAAGDARRLRLQLLKRRLAAVFRQRGNGGRNEHRRRDTRRLIPVGGAEQKHHIDGKCHKQDLDDRIAEPRKKLPPKALSPATGEAVVAELSARGGDFFFVQSRIHEIRSLPIMYM